MCFEWLVDWHRFRRIVTTATRQVICPYPYMSLILTVLTRRRITVHHLSRFVNYRVLLRVSWPFFKMLFSLNWSANPLLLRNQKFIALLTIVCHWTVYYESWNHSTPSASFLYYPHTYAWVLQMIFSRSKLRKHFSFSAVPITCLALIILIYQIILSVSGGCYIWWSILQCRFIHSPAASRFLHLACISARMDVTWSLTEIKRLQCKVRFALTLTHSCKFEVSVVLCNLFRYPFI